MRIIIPPVHAAVKTLMTTLDTDTETLNAYLTVQKMAETNDEEKRLYVGGKSRSIFKLIHLLTNLIDPTEFE